MGDFLKDIAKPSWWLGVVVVGLILNVVASYIRDWINHTRRSVSDRMRVRGDRYRAEVVLQADKIRGQPYSCMFHLMRSISVQISVIVIMLWGFASIFTALIGLGEVVKILCILSGAFSLWTAFKLDRLATFMQDVAQEATRNNYTNQDANDIAHKSEE